MKNLQKLLLVQSAINWEAYLKILEGAYFFSNVHLNFASVTMTKAYTIVSLSILETVTLFIVLFTWIIKIRVCKKNKTQKYSDQLLVTNIFEIWIILMNRKHSQKIRNFCHLQMSIFVSSDWQTFEWFRSTYAWPSSCSRLGLWCQLFSSWTGVLNWQD